MVDTVIGPGFNNDDFIGVPRTCYVGSRRDRRRAFRKFLNENREFRAFAGVSRAERRRMVRIAWSNIAQVNLTRSPG